MLYYWDKTSDGSSICCSTVTLNCVTFSPQNLMHSSLSHNTSLM